MYVGPAQLVVNAFTGGSKVSAAQKHMFETLQAKHVGAAPSAQPYAQTLIDLSRGDDTFSSMFDVLRIEPNAKGVVFDMMKRAGVF